MNTKMYYNCIENIREYFTAKDSNYLRSTNKDTWKPHLTPLIN